MLTKLMKYDFRSIRRFGLPMIIILIAVYIFMMTDGDPSLFVIVCALFCSTFLKNGYNKKTENKRG